MLRSPVDLGEHVFDPSRQSQRLEELIVEIEQFPDARARALMQKTLQAVLELHSAGLQRILQLVNESGPFAERLRDALTRDGLASALMLLHDLHPRGLETRLREALEKVLPYIHGHGGNIELLSIENGVAKLRLEGACKGCPSSAGTMEHTVKNAIADACPDLKGIEIEGMLQTAAPNPFPLLEAKSM